MPRILHHICGLLTDPSVAAKSFIALSLVAVILWMALGPVLLGLELDRLFVLPQICPAALAPRTFLADRAAAAVAAYCHRLSGREPGAALPVP